MEKHASKCWNEEGIKPTKGTTDNNLDNQYKYEPQSLCKLYTWITGGFFLYTYFF